MKTSKKYINVILIVIIVLGIISFFMIGNHSKDRKMPDADGNTGEIVNGVVVSQNFINKTEDINEIAVVFSRDYYLEENADIVIELICGNETLISTTINADDIQAYHRTYLKTDSPISGYMGKELTLNVYTTSSAGTGLFLMVNSKANESYIFGNQTYNGTICFSVSGK